MPNKTIGYIRTSKNNQNLGVEVQKEALIRYNIDSYFIEQISGRKENRKELNKALESLEKGDTLVVYKIDRLGRSTKQLVNIMSELQEKGINLISIKENIDTSTPMGKVIFTILSAIAELEADYISERTKEALALAIKGYELVGSDTEEKEMVIKKGENTMTFTYKQVKEVVANAENVEFLNGKQMTAVIPKGLTMYVVYKGEVIGKAENQKSFFNRAMFADFDPTLEPTTLNLTKEVAKGDTVQYYTENAEGEKSETLEITRPEDVNPPVDPTDPTDPVDPTEPTNPVEPTEPTTPTTPTDPEKPTDNGDGNGNVVTDNEGTTDTTTTDTNKETTKEDSKEKETKDRVSKLPDTGSDLMSSAFLTSSGLVLVLGIVVIYKKFMGSK